MTTRIWMRGTGTAVWERWLGHERMPAIRPGTVARRTVAVDERHAAGNGGRLVVPVASIAERLALGLLGAAAISSLGLAVTGFVAAVGAW